MTARRPRTRLAALALAAMAGTGCDLVYPWSSDSNPGAPQGVRAAFTSFDSVELSWATEDGVGAYELSGRVAAGSWSVIGRVSGRTSRVELGIDADVPEAVDLGFRVRAIMGDLASEWSPEAVAARGLRAASSFTASFSVWPTPPGTPVQLTWQRGSTAATELVLERRTMRGGVEVAPWAPLAGVGVADVSLLDTDVGSWADGARLEYRLSYVLGALESDSVLAQTEPAPAAASVGLAASSTGGLGIHLAWAAVTQVTWAQQIVQRSTYDAGNAWEDVATLARTASSLDDTVPAAGGYLYRIVVRAAGLPDAPGDPVAAATATGPLAPRFVDLPGIPVDRDAEGSYTLVGYGPGSLLEAYLPDASGWSRHDVTGSSGAWLAPPYLRAPDGTVHLLYTVSTSGAARDWHDADGWHTESLPFRPTDAAIDTAGALHLVACKDGLDLTYATNCSGAWVSGPVPHSGVANECAIAVGPDGEPQIAWAGPKPYIPGSPYPQLDVAFAVHGTSGWQAEALPPAAAVIPSTPDVFRLLTVAGGTTLVLDTQHTTIVAAVLDAWDRGPDGWGPAERIGTFAADISDAKAYAAVSPDGTRVAIAGRVNYAPPAVAVRDPGGAWRTWPLAGTWVNSVGFDASGKLWVYTGLALYEER